MFKRSSKYVASTSKLLNKIFPIIKAFFLIAQGLHFHLIAYEPRMQAYLVAFKFLSKPSSINKLLEITS